MGQIDRSRSRDRAPSAIAAILRNGGSLLVTLDATGKLSADAVLPVATADQQLPRPAEVAEGPPADDAPPDEA